MIEPKLRLIPSAYKAGTLYSPLPSNGDGDFTFSRATTATRVNKDGLIEDVSADVPRIDYSDSSCPSLLLEPTRTNLITYSENFSSWSPSRVSVSSDVSISPTGELNADKLIEDNTLAQHRLDLGTTSAIGVNTFSVFVKKGERDFIWLRIGSSGAVFDLTNGSNSIISGLDDAYSQDFGNGWYRCIIVRTSTSANETCRINMSSSIVPLDYQGDSVSGIYIFGAQLEQGNYPTSYIPTSGSTSTRNQDYCNGTGDATLFNDKEGVLYFESKGLVDIPETNGYIQLSKSGETGFDNSLVIQHRNNGALRIYVNGSAGTDLHFNIDIDFTQNHKIAVLYKLNGYKLFIDGVSQSLSGTPTQTVFSGLDDLSFDLRGSTNWNGKVKDLRYYNTELTDAELIELTTL